MDFSPLFIQGLRLRHHELPEESYVQGIAALAGLESLSFELPVAFGFNAEGGTFNQRFSTSNTHSDLS